MSRQRLPTHVGFIPDGNRRWAQQRGLPKQAGYEQGIGPGLALVERCIALGIPELSIYGFTQDNTRRPGEQRQAFTAACVDFASACLALDAALLVLGDSSSDCFPTELQGLCQRSPGRIRVNLLVNYGWQWDLDGMRQGHLRSEELPRMDLIVRWGGGRRLSGFLPAQSVYADFYVVDELWPDYQESQLDAALAWFGQQDRTLGG